MRIERHCAVEALDGLFGPADKVEEDAEHAVPIGKVRIESDRPFGSAQGLVKPPLPGKRHGERPQRIGVPFIEPHGLLRGFLGLLEGLSRVLAPFVRIAVRQRRGEEGESRREAWVELGGAPQQPLGLAVGLL